MLKKWIGFILLGLIVLLAGCGGTGEIGRLVSPSHSNIKKGKKPQLKSK
ncbi:hypothetical protein [Bacillus sp. T3]|nr:hypothetical protein [Bacillus sp. T3]